MYCSPANTFFFHEWDMLAKIKQICILNHVIMEKIKQKINWFFLSNCTQQYYYKFWFLILAWFKYIFSISKHKNINFASSKLWVIPLSSKMVTYLMIESLYSWNEIRYIYIHFRILWWFFLGCHLHLYDLQIVITRVK